MENNVNDAIIDEAVKRFKEGKIKNNADVENFIDNLVQPLYQKLLDAELSNMLSYEWYEHKRDTENSKNGYCKTEIVQTKYGAIEIKTPRDRNGKFEDIVLSLCAKGMSYQDISSLLKEIYRVDISKG